MSTPDQSFGSNPQWGMILSLAATDPDFRRSLLENPRKCIAERFGAVPSKFKMRFIESDEDVDVIFVLPKLRPGGLLSDDDLDAVTGGDGGGLW